MRRIAFALALMIASGWAAPSQAQWWGGGWGRPCFGGCRVWRDGGGWAGPRPVIVLGDAFRPNWGGPDAFGPPWFRAGGGVWRRAMWRREMRWRRLEAWRRWAVASRHAAPPETLRPPAQRPTRWRPPFPPSAAAMRPEPSRTEAAGAARNERRGPDRGEAVVAMMPAGALHLARTRAHAAIPTRVLAAAALLRRPDAPSSSPAPVVRAVIRPTGSSARPARLHALPVSAPSAEVHPVALHNQPAAAPVSAPPAVRPVPAPAAPAPEAVKAAPADVPVAPLD